MTANAKLLKAALADPLSGPETMSVNNVAGFVGWGWHRTNNAMKELGLK